MKKILILLSAAVSLFSASAFGQYTSAYNPTTKNSWYISTTGNINWQKNIGANTGGFMGLPKTVKIDKYNTGFGGAIALGYQVDESWRVEIEGSHKHNNIKYNNKIFGDKLVGFRTNTSVMANAFYEEPIADKVKFYVGLGAGYSHVKLEAAKMTRIKDNLFAFQVIPGFAFEISDHVDMTLGYRFFATTKTAVEKALGSNIPYSNNVEAGLRFKF